MAPGCAASQHHFFFQWVEAMPYISPAWPTERCCGAFQAARASLSYTLMPEGAEGDDLAWTVESTVARWIKHWFPMDVPWMSHGFPMDCDPGHNIGSPHISSSIGLEQPLKYPVALGPAWEPTRNDQSCYVMRSAAGSGFP